MAKSSMSLLIGAALPLLGLTRAQEQGQNATAASQPYRSFNATPIALNYTVTPENPDALTDGSLFLCPRNPGDADFADGPLIVSNTGEVIWDGTAEPYNFGQGMAFEPSLYMGQQVIALWQGQFFGGGYGDGYGLILNSSYSVIANVSSTIEGEGNDFHEFQITNDDTALILVYAAKEHDLSQYNVTTEDGTDGWIFDNYVQEINIETGEALFTWSALDHLDPTQGYAEPGDTGISRESAWDFLHLNSIEKDSSGNYLISSRHFSTLFYLSPEGDIIWQMNGRNSSFEMGEDTVFHYQHDARWLEEGTRLSLFDNAATGWVVEEPRARSMILNIDMDAMTVSLEQEYFPYVDEASPSQGSTRVQPNGDVLSDFGSQPWAVEHNAAGDTLWAASYPEGVQNYRIVRSSWTGMPRTDPSIYVDTSSDNNTVSAYVSWNGDTRVTQWRVHAAQDASNSSDPQEFSKAGFETVYSFQLDWPEGVDSMLVWAEGVVGDDVLGTTQQVTLTRDGEGATVSEQSGISNATAPSTDGDSGSNSTSGSGEGDGDSDDEGNGSLATISGGGCLALVAAAFASALLL